jgi:superfamily II DNA or RNA helicase
MNALVGFVIYSKTTLELEKEGYLCPSKTYFLGCPQNDDQFESNEYHENYQSFITKNEKRNDTIKSIVGAWKSKKKILILVKSIEHGEMLESMIDDSFFLYGSTPKKKRKDMFEKFKNENGLVMISMVSIMGIGINIPNLDMIINASAFGSDISSVQTIGRTKRKSEGKKYGMFIDFNDENLFQPMANKRMKMLEEFGNPVDKSLHITQWRSMNFD